MKTIIFIISFFSFVCLVKGEELVSYDLPYYIKTNNDIVNVKKVYDKDTSEVVFNMTIDNYAVNNNFTKHIEFKKSIWKHSKYYIGFFDTIVYYGYLNNPTDLNYYLTQIMIWNYICGLNFTITDEFGNELSNLNEAYNKLIYIAEKHRRRPFFFFSTHSSEIWNNNHFYYQDNNLILDNEILEELDIKTEDKTINIYNKMVGNYQINFYKNYEQETYCYSDGTNVYWQSLKGPESIEYTLNYNVYGTKLTIKENLIGINDRVGDAYLNSKYEIYLDNELKLSTSNFENIYVKSNSNYVLKDISNNDSTYNIENVSFKVEDSEYLLELDKFVISKNLSLTINDDKEYYIYLKSNNELYEKVDKNTLLITLPYGKYFIKNNDNYYMEFAVFDDIDEELVIDYEEDILEEKDESNLEDIIIEEIVNPQTGDYIYLHIFNLFLALYCILILKWLLSN